MQINFYKYQGTANDFILIDNRSNMIQTLSNKQIAQWCHRRLGIGADGLMLLQHKEGYDFEMVYYNADGNISSMCGNGGRCITEFANHLGMLPTGKARFWAIDGEHQAVVSALNYVQLQMKDVSHIDQQKNYTLLDTGSPHYISFVSTRTPINIVEEGSAIRYSPLFAAEGVNVNFVMQHADGTLEVATYERGVEDETWSCGTGVTASAIAYHAAQMPTEQSVEIVVKTKGGQLQVNFDYQDGVYSNIWLCGPALLVFEGIINL